MDKNNEKKIPRTHKFHPKMLDLIKECADVMKVKNPFTVIEVAVIKEAERIDVIRPKEIGEYYHKCKVKVSN